MTMDIHIHSRLSSCDTVNLISDAISELKRVYGSRFWFSEVKSSSRLSRHILLEDFGFEEECGLIVSDTTKEFDGLDAVARSLRDALGKENSMVIYADTGKPFPEDDYTRSVVRDQT